MPRYATVTAHLAQDELADRYRHAHDPVARSHWHIVWLVAQGHRVPEVATLVGYTGNWVRTILRRYNTAGPAGIGDRRQDNPGAKPLLSPELREDLREVLAAPPPDGGLWTSAKVAAWMADRLGRPVGEPRGWEAMRSLGYTPQRPRPRAVRADPVVQAAFKKGGSKRRSMRQGTRILPRGSRSGPRTNTAWACCPWYAGSGPHAGSARPPGSTGVTSGCTSMPSSALPPAKAGGVCCRR